MERRYESRLREMLAQAQVPPELVDGLLNRLEDFMRPYTAALSEPEQKRHAREYVTGLLSNLRHKTGEGIAYLHDQDRQGMQKFIGDAPWDDHPLVNVLVDDVATELGEPDGVLVFDPSGFPKKGTKSVGVARQWCGRLSKVDNCQVGIYMAYVSRKGQTLVGVRLYLPEDWTKNRGRRKEAGVPKEIKFHTRHELALQMLDEYGGRLPHTWVTGDDEMGRPSRFREALRERGQRYLLAVPSNVWIRDGEVPPPPFTGRGRVPMVPFQRVDKWAANLPEDAWTRIEVRDGEKGPLVIESVKRRVFPRTRTDGTGPEEQLLVTRERQSEGTYKHDYYLSNGDSGVPLQELVHVANAEHRVEECLKRAKGHAGLGDYQVRTWTSWHHHQTLALVAAWFLAKETRRKKNLHPRFDVAATPKADCWDHRQALKDQQKRRALASRHPLADAEREGKDVLLSFA
jgi:SRSO17 transposase